MEIGYKVKTLRLKNNLTQEELADRCDLTKGYISQLENDLTNPTLDTLNDILVVLGSNLGDFFQDNEPEQVVFTDADFVIKDYGDTSIKWLVSSAQKYEMEPIILELKEKDSEEPDMPHEGEEFGYVLQGKIKVVVGRKSYTVCENEAFYYKADKRHKIVNLMDGVSKVLWISCPPNF